MSEQFWGVAAPGKTPPDMANRLSETLRKALQMPQLREQFAREGGEPVPMTQEEFSKYVLADVNRWRQIVKDIGLKLERRHDPEQACISSAHQIRSSGRGAWRRKIGRASCRERV